MPLYTAQELQTSIAATKAAIEKAKRSIATRDGDVSVARENLKALREQLDYEYAELQKLDPITHKPAPLFAAAVLD